MEQSKNDKRPAIREEGGDEVIQMIGANEGYRKFFEGVSERNDTEIEQK